jgi:hypothetical protein
MAVAGGSSLIDHFDFGPAGVPVERHDSEGGFSSHSGVPFEIGCEPGFSVVDQEAGVAGAEEGALVG